MGKGAGDKVYEVIFMRYLTGWIASAWLEAMGFGEAAEGLRWLLENCEEHLTL